MKLRAIAIALGLTFALVPLAEAKKRPPTAHPTKQSFSRKAVVKGKRGKVAKATRQSNKRQNYSAKKRKHVG
jgi:hypothetical protein